VNIGGIKVDNDMGQFTPMERIEDANEDMAFVKKYRKVRFVNEQQIIVDAVFKRLKEQDRKKDIVQFLCELETCTSLDQIKKLADWYLDKPRLEEGGK
jgi:hypothetical protein